MNRSTPFLNLSSSLIKINLHRKLFSTNLFDQRTNKMLELEPRLLPWYPGEEINDLRICAEDLVRRYGCQILCGCSPRRRPYALRPKAQYETIQLPPTHAIIYLRRQFRCNSCHRISGVQTVIDRSKTNYWKRKISAESQREPDYNEFTPSPNTPESEIGTTYTPIPHHPNTPSASEIMKSLQDTLDKLKAAHNAETATKDTEVDGLKEELKEAIIQKDNSDVRVKELEAKVEELNARVKQLEEENEDFRGDKKKLTDLMVKWLGEGNLIGSRVV